MVDDRNVMMSAVRAQSLTGNSDGKDLHWSTNVQDELPIKMRQSGPGSEAPFTLCDMFMNAVRAGQDRPAMWIERNGQKLCWSWKLLRWFYHIFYPYIFPNSFAGSPALMLNS